MGMATLHLSTGSFLEALGSALVRFHLRHKFLGGSLAPMHSHTGEIQFGGSKRALSGKAT